MTRVHFAESNDEGDHTGKIIVTKASETLWKVHLGILNTTSRYSIKFPINIDSSKLADVSKGQFDVESAQVVDDENAGTPSLRTGIHSLKHEGSH